MECTWTQYFKLETKQQLCQWVKTGGCATKVWGQLHLLQMSKLVILEFKCDSFICLPYQRWKVHSWLATWKKKVRLGLPFKETKHIPSRQFISLQRCLSNGAIKGICNLLPPFPRIASWAAASITISLARIIVAYRPRSIWIQDFLYFFPNISVSANLSESLPTTFSAMSFTWSTLLYELFDPVCTFNWKYAFTASIVILFCKWHLLEQRSVII